MNLTGTATLHADVERVYAALNDPAVLVRTIPGCERLEQVGESAYRMTVTAGVASIKGSYVGDVRLTDQEAPHAFVLRARGAGAPGTVDADVTVSLAAGEDGTTVLSYDAAATVGGAVGGVGQRILSGVARKTAGQFFAAVDDVLTGADAATEAPGDREPAPEPAPEPAVGRPSGHAGMPLVYTDPVPGRAPAPPGGDFVRGAVFGAAVALLGAVVGGLLVGRRGRSAA